MVCMETKKVWDYGETLTRAGGSQNAQKFWRAAWRGVQEWECNAMSTTSSMQKAGTSKSGLFGPWRCVSHCLPLKLLFFSVCAIWLIKSSLWWTEEMTSHLHRYMLYQWMSSQSCYVTPLWLTLLRLPLQWLQIVHCVTSSCLLPKFLTVNVRLNRKPLLCCPIDWVILFRGLSFLCSCHVCQSWRGGKKKKICRNH